jgi:hypothetical protein
VLMSRLTPSVDDPVVSVSVSVSVTAEADQELCTELIEL